MNIVYMGTPDFSVPPLEAMIGAGHTLLAAFTQPDKAKGRSGKLLPPPVKECALKHDIPVYQPEKLRDAENVALIKDLAPDVIVVAAYGQILSEEILNIPKYGCVNIHASLLPKYRGAAPIERAIIDGEAVTGVTTMYMAKGLDTGDMLEKTEIVIGEEDTALTLESKLSQAGSELILKTLEALENGTATRTPQDDAASTYAAKLSKEEGRIDFAKSAEEIARMVRGFNPWPCAYTTLLSKSVKLYGAKAVENDIKKDAAPGEVIAVTKKNFTIACGSGALTVTSLQPEGKKQMDAAAYLNGAKLTVGEMAG